MLYSNLATFFTLSVRINPMNWVLGMVTNPSGVYCRMGFVLNLSQFSLTHTVSFLCKQGFCRWQVGASLILKWNRKTHNYMPTFSSLVYIWNILACNCGCSCFIRGQYSKFWFTFSLHQKLQISVTCFHLSPHSSNILWESQLVSLVIK